MRDIMEDIRENAIMVGTIALWPVFPEFPETYANLALPMLSQVFVVIN